MKTTARSVIVLVLLLAGCPTRRDSESCNVENPCSDPVLYVCNLDETDGGRAGRCVLRDGDGGLDPGDGGDAGSGAAMLEFSPLTQDFGPVVANGSSVPVRFTVTNRGSRTSGVPSAALSDAAHFTIESNTCTSPLSASAACTLNVSFTPKAPAGPKSATLTVSGAPGGMTMASLSGTALMPGDIRVAPTQQAFGMVAIGGMSTDLPLVLTNTGGAASGVPGLTLLDTINYTLSRGTCTAPVDPGMACTFSVRFNPTTLGDKVTSVMVSATPGGDSAVSLSGTGTAALTIMKTGSGTGKVTSLPAGIDCGATCTFAFASSPVMIAAMPDATADFLGWSGGGCTGTASCAVTLDTAKTVMATFETKRPAPRPIAPLSTATATSRRPTLRWELAAGTDGAHVEICPTRACTTTITSFDAPGTSGAPATDLPRGVVFWRLYPRTGAATGTLVSPTWQLTIGARSAPVNTSWGTTLDFNGDGYADVVVGAPGMSGAGRVYTYAGGASGLSATPGPTVTGPDIGGGLFGFSVASAGDVNGDGFGDVVVGAFGFDGSKGRAYLYQGGASGLAVSAATLTGPDVSNANFGISVASAGDVNGDGYSDVVVGASHLNGPGATNSAGRAYLYLGSALGLSNSPAPIAGPNVAGGLFGRSVSSAGDVNGDGFADVVVGAYGVNSEAGRAYLYVGSMGGLSVSPATIVGPDVAGGDFGISVACAGDVNGDGYADVVVGASGISGVNALIGKAYVYLGIPLGLSANPATTLAGPDLPNARFGNSVASAGDVNGDGFTDVVVGAQGVEAASGSNGLVGRAYVFHGGATGLSMSPTPTLFGPDIMLGEFGRSVAGAGDVNGDGYADVAVGAANGTGGEGRAFVYPGSASGVSMPPAPTLTGPNVGGARFGDSLASAPCQYRATPMGRPQWPPERSRPYRPERRS